MALRIHLAGPVRVEVDGVAVDDTGLGSLGRLTLAFLVSERHRPGPTDELAEALWGEELPPTWRTALRGLASKLRVFLARAGLDRAQILASGAGWYQLCLPESVVVDVEEAETSLAVAEEALRAARAGVVGRADGARAAADVALEVASRPFLVAARGAWVERRQAELAEVRLRALEASAEACTLAGDSAQGVARAEEAVSLDPWRESAYVRLMVAHAASGNRGAALRAYERCRRLLADELGVRPSPQTEAAYVDLLGAEPTDEAGTRANPTRSSLPLPLTSFVGREGERNEVCRLLGGTRLVTLTGPGGVGKSRLALEVARELEGEDADGPAADAVDGVALVELAPLADPQRVPERVADVLGLTPCGGGDVVGALVSHLTRRRVLLVLDNCEHLVDACAELAEHLLASCPEVRILATSQSRLRVPGEAIITLAPLPVPQPATATAEEAAASEAVRLFLDRAAEARIGAVLTEDTAGAVADICRRLDGLPLALELAASQVATLSMEEIAAGLDDRFRLLADGPRTAPTRHRALRTTLDWAHDRLSDAEARLLARLSVFAGGFTLAAAGAVVCGADGGEADDDDDDDVFPLLSSLVDASLVQADPRTGVTRYRLLESVRAYAGERLERSGEALEVRRRHLQWATSLAEEAAAELEGPEQRAGLDRLQAEHANLAAALAWSTSGMDGAPGTALRLAALLGRYWEVRGHLAEGRAWLEWALSEPSPHESRPTRARALGAAAGLAQRQGNYVAARRYHEEGLAVHRAAGDLSGEAAALHGLGQLDALAGDVSSARSRYLNTLAIGRQLGASTVMATALANLGWLAQGQGDATARTLLEESLRLHRRAGSTYGVAWSQYFLGRLAESKGDLIDARACYDESLTLRRELGDRAGLADSLAALASVALHQGDLEAAGAGHEESLVLRRELGDRSGELESLRHLGDVARVGGLAQEARRRYQASLDIAEDLDDTCCVTRARLGLAKVARAEGRRGEVGALLERALPEGCAPGPDIVLAEWLEQVAGHLLDEHDLDDVALDDVALDGEAASVARLLAAAEALRVAADAPVPAGERAGHEADVVRLPRALGDQTGDAGVLDAPVTAPADVLCEARRHLRRGSVP